MTSLVVSHDVSSVFRTAEQVAFLSGGRLIFHGSPEEFRDSAEGPIREILEKAEATTFA
jgi:phospholipid/cholesterol/gamma-HCH transport system ATP-binding protein